MNEPRTTARRTIRHALLAFAVVAALAVALLLATTAQAKDRPFCWVVRSGTATAYLLGSIHVARPDVYPLPEELEKAFGRSETLVVEADARGPGAAAAAGGLLELATYPPGDSLDQHVPKKLFDEVAARLPLPREQLLRFRPWMLSLTLTMGELARIGITPQNGIDLHFLNRAGDRRVIELESIEQQLQMLAGFEEKQQVLFLEYTLRDLERLEENIDEMLRVWKSGDEKRLEKLVFEGRQAEPELEPVYQKLFDERNVEMAVRITELLRGKETHFVVVGAGHLVGDTGLLALLSRDFQIAPL